MKYRLYIFVPYNISPIQQGIQAGHAALEYGVIYGKTKEAKSFIENDKTWVILNGGTTRDSSFYVQGGTLNEIEIQLREYLVNYASFREPDLNNALTAVCFLADERVWDLENYPDYENWWCTADDTNLNTIPSQEKWVLFVGGEKNAFLRELLRDKHLA
jgi:hypothetical protein